MSGIRIARRHPTRTVAIAALCAAGCALAANASAPPPPPPPPQSPPSGIAGAAAPSVGSGTFPDAAGQWSNIDAAGPLSGNPFFEPLGSNGRSCASCHVESDAWTATPPNLQLRFKQSAGEDPVFASVDGTNCPTLPIATPAEHQSASSLLLTKGLIRIALTPPTAAQFAVTDVVNPYGCSSTTSISVYRRILTTANLKFLSTVMWDGRESLGGASIANDLLHQAGTAVTTHEAGAAVPAAAVLQAIELAESGQFAAQASDAIAGSLSAAGALGGDQTLLSLPFTFGENDPFGTGSATTPGVPPNAVFTLYKAWETLSGADPVSLRRASIGRGERIFNTRPITITGVAGLNDQTSPNGEPRTVIVGTCGTCHDTPNAGSHSLRVLMDTGIADAARRTSDLPLLTLINRTTGATVQTSDAGLAFTTGLWADINKFKVPTLRLLAPRAPYFHNGSAATLDAVVNFYDQRFDLGLSAQEHADLVAFLSAL